MEMDDMAHSPTGVGGAGDDDNDDGWGDDADWDEDPELPDQDPELEQWPSTVSGQAAAWEEAGALEK